TISFTGSTNYIVSNIFAFSADTAFVCMGPLTGTGGVIAKTTDGGLTWSTANSPAFTNSWANFIHFFNANDGVCMGDPTGDNQDFVIYTTTNGGASWTQVIGANIPNASGAECGTINFYDAFKNTLWFGTTIGRVFKSTDKGLTWTVSSTGLSYQTDVRFKEANTGFAILRRPPYTMKKTTDGGTTWNAITPSGYFVKQPFIDFIPGTAMWVDVSNGPNRGSSYSIDDCNSFIDIDTGSVQYTCVSFYDINTGWAGGYNSNSTDGGIWK
ncbi:MAG: hypothetical protein HY738_15970, partial [Bacteroidia bacterium]|nr:hypothetical protein [Bacteroidia bacterium]